MAACKLVRIADGGDAEGGLDGCCKHGRLRTSEGRPRGRPGLVSLGEADRHEQVQVAVLVGGADQRRLEPVLEFEDDLLGGDAGDAVGE